MKMIRFNVGCARYLLPTSSACTALAHLWGPPFRNPRRINLLDPHLSTTSPSFYPTHCLSTMPKAPSAGSNSKAAPVAITKSSKADIDDIFGARPSSTPKVDAASHATPIKKKKKNKKTADVITNPESSANPSSSTTTQPSEKPTVQNIVDPSMVIAGPGKAASKGASKPPAAKARMDEDEMAFLDSRGTGPREWAETLDGCRED